MFKRFIAILCCIAVLSFSCILTPATKASRMQIEAEASAGLAVAGVTLAVVVCVVLLWYGISVNTDSTEAQSCLEFVKEKAEAAGIAASTLSLYAFMYMYQIGEWVAEWVASTSEIYEISSSVSGVFSADKTSLLIDKSCQSGIIFSGIVPSVSSDRSQSVTLYVGDQPAYYFLANNGSLYCVSKGTNTYFQFSGSLNGSLSASGNSYRGYGYYCFNYGSMNPNAILILSSAGYNFAKSSLTVSSFIDRLVSGSVDYPSISADVNKEVVIPAAKDVFDGTGSLDDYQLDNPDVIDFGSALSQLQSATGNPALTWEDVIGGVNTGEISVSDVLDATDTVPYVLTDSRTGELADVDTPAEFVKPVALTDELAIPDAQTIADSEPYTPKYNKNSDTGKYRLPLFQFFPFCLPYDLYDFLSKLDVEACAPVWEIDTTPLFKHLRFFKADDGYKITIDLSKYDDIFSIIRVFECIGIIVGFVFVSRKLIHGGD